MNAYQMRMLAESQCKYPRIMQMIVNASMKGNTNLMIDQHFFEEVVEKENDYSETESLIHYLRRHDFEVRKIDRLMSYHIKWD